MKKMSTLILAPSARGKTQYVLEQARHAARTLATMPVVCVATQAQARSARRRLAAMGGALGVRVFTFDQLYTWILYHTRTRFTELHDAALFRLMQAVADARTHASEPAQQWQHFGSIAHTPGLIEVLRDRIAELKGARVDPHKLAQRWQHEDAPGRLRDLAAVYGAWQQRLIDEDWADRPGVAWLTLDVLETTTQPLPQPHAPIYFDGFDSFTQVQLDVIAALAKCHAGGVTITLTGNIDDSGDEPEYPPHMRFHQTRLRLARAMPIHTQALPAPRDPASLPPALLHLQNNIFAPQPETFADTNGALTLLEATNRVVEVRAALRWIKARVVEDGIPVSDCALLVRDMDAYRAYILQYAAEYGIPVALEGGLALDENPALRALLALLNMLLPQPPAASQPAITTAALPLLPRRALVEMWRSPWFDLSTVGVKPGDAERMDAIARVGLVIRGVNNWRRALETAAQAARAAQNATSENGDSDEPAPPQVDDATRLQEVFERFLARVMPHPFATRRTHILWLEGVLGAVEVDSTTGEVLPARADDSLRMIARIHAGKDATYHRDIAALFAFKEVLRGMLWAEENLGDGNVTYAEFVSELHAALDGVEYTPAAETLGALFAGTTVQARGVPFAVVAILGMEEGVLPARQSEDPFLRDAERAALQSQFPGLQLSTESGESEYFLEAISRPSQSLLLTRPRLAANGAASEPSPYWGNVLRAFPALKEQVVQEKGGATTHASHAASLAELVLSLAHTPHPQARAWLDMQQPQTVAHVHHASTILRARSTPARSVWDGDVSHRPDLLARHFNPRKQWSPTALESYLACSYLYFTDRLLHLAPRVEPEEAVTPLQIGNIMHGVLQELFAPGQPVADEATMLARLEPIATRHLADAPRTQGFVATPMWAEQAHEILENLRASVRALVALESTPIAVELSFRDASALKVTDGSHSVRISGVIDRVDRRADGSLLVIDYKSGVSDYGSQTSLAQGRKLQIALYAMAVRQHANLLEPNGAPDDAGAHTPPVVDGFYFFLNKGEPAKWTLQSYGGGLDGALEAATTYALQAARGAGAGEFKPTPPENGCPAWCPAAGFCWHYAPKSNY